MVENIKRLQKTKIWCPCCGKERGISAINLLLAIESKMKQQNCVPWLVEYEGWTVKDASTKKLQWACPECLRRKRVISANPCLQTFCDFPPYLAYFDVKVRCQDCEAIFVFAAGEQQFWYENLKFYVQSRPNQCPDCRKKRRAKNQWMAELQETIKVLDEKNPDDLLQIAELLLKLENKSKALVYLRRARKKIKNPEKIAIIDEQIAKLLS